MNLPMVLSSEKDLMIQIQIPRAVVAKYPAECKTLNDTLIFHLENFNKRLEFFEEVSKLEHKIISGSGKEEEF